MNSGLVIDPKEVSRRLDSLGYCVVPEDNNTIEYLIEKISQKVKLNTNAVEFPEELIHMTIDCICGEFLATKYALGQLKNFDSSGTIKRKTAGDTTIEYAYGSGDKTPEQRYVEMFNNLRKLDKDMLASVRRLRW